MARLFGLVAVLLCATNASAQTITAVRPPSWGAYVDASGVFIGTPAGGTLESPQLLFRLNSGDLFALELQRVSNRSNLLTWRRSHVWFEGLGCTGRAAIQADQVPPSVGRRIAAIAFGTNMLWLSAPDAQPEPFSPQSIQNDDGLCQNGTVNGDMIVVTAVTDLDGLYVEPFRLDVRRFRWFEVGVMSGTTARTETKH